ncbi:MAG: aminotransferase class IV [Synergistaceae bacterium]
MILCYFDGEFKDISEVHIPVTDLIVQRGIGVFDSMRTYNKAVFAMTYHINRLAKSAKLSGMVADDIIAQLPDIIREGLKNPALPQNVELMVKPYITAGDVNNRGIFPAPRFFVVFEEVHAISDEKRQNGVSLKPVYSKRQLPEIKSINYMTAYVSMSKAEDSDFESLYIFDGEIAEATSSSFFICKNGKLITAPLGKVLRSITRDVLFTVCAENGIEIEERSPMEEELKTADEAFIAASTKEVLGIVKVGDVIIGDGKVGPLTKRVHQLFLDNIYRWTE